MMLKKALCLCLALLLTFCTLTAFTACSKNGEVSVGFATKELDLTDARLIYQDRANGESVSGSFKTEMANFATRLGQATGVSMIAEGNSAAGEETGESLEILVGSVDREESKKVKKSIKGDGFAIRVMKNKIVIVGSNTMMTLYAVDYFTDHYLSHTSESGTLTLNKKVYANKMEMLTLADSDGCDFTFVYEYGLDNKKGNKWTSAGKNNDYDFPYAMLIKATEELKKSTGLAERDFAEKGDNTEPTANELTMGIVDREEVTECLAEIPANGYGLFTTDEKIIVTAWSDDGLKLSSALFFDLLLDATVTDDDGKVSVRFPKGLSITGTFNEDWVTEFPKPEGVQLYNAQDAGDDALQYLYMGEGVNADAYHAYYDTLLDAGYRLLCENEIEDSLFATFVQDDEGHTLNVSYNAFKHGASNFNYKPRLRVISAPLSSVNLPDADILNPEQEYKKMTDSTITAVHLEEGYVGMGYVIMLEDGRFIVFDGGHTNGKQTMRLYEILLSLYSSAHPNMTEEDKPTIAAWFITHSHGDHYNLFNQFLNSFVRTGYVKLERVMGNFPSAMTVYNAGESDLSMSNSIYRIAEMNGATFIKIHSGQKYYFANTEVEVLCTQEDLNPQRIEYFNDTSATVRLTMTATDGEGNPVQNKAATTTSIWTGDAFIYSSRYMSGMYGTYLKSDMVQVAHHGNDGCEQPFYGFIKPTVVWFPNTVAAYKSYTGGWRTDWQSKVDYYLVHELGTVRYVYVSDTNNITLSLTETGPLYGLLYDPESRTFVSYNTAVGNAIRK